MARVAVDRLIGSSMWRFRLDGVLELWFQPFLQRPDLRWTMFLLLLYRVSVHLSICSVSMLRRLLLRGIRLKMWGETT